MFEEIERTLREFTRAALNAAAVGGPVTLPRPVPVRVSGLHLRLSDATGWLAEASGGEGLLSALSEILFKQAVATAMAANRDVSGLPNGLRAQWWLLLGQSLVTGTSAERWFRPASHGITIVIDDHIGCLYPWEFRPTGRLRTPSEALSDVTKRAGLPPGSFKLPTATVVMSHWRPVGAVGGRGAHAVTDPEADRLVRSAAERLMAGQTPDGFYLYWYEPLTDHSSVGPGSLIRQAGTAAAMARFARREPSTPISARALTSSTATLHALQRHMSWDRSGSLQITEDTASSDPCTLGVLALTLLLAQTLPPSPASTRISEDLVTSILRLQREDGSFACWTNGDTDGEDRKQAFYSGEALLALSMHTGPQRTACAEAIGGAFKWYEAFFRRAPTTAFVAWHALAWSSVACTTPTGVMRDQQAGFVLEMADWLLQFQLPPHAHPYSGGFSVHGPTPGCATASYVEALVHAYGVACRTGDTKRARRYLRAARRAFAFLNRLAVTPEMGSGYLRPELAIGGTRANLSTVRLRCDNDQHTMTSMMTALDDGRIFASSPRLGGD
jgi:hypothetical protein